jgi:hypothetical protein
LIPALSIYLVLNPITISKVDISWHPAEKVDTEKTFVLGATLRSQNVRWLINGGPPERFLDYTFSIEMHERYILLDEMQKVGPNRPDTLARRIEAIEVCHAIENEAQPNILANRSVRFQCDLTGKTVIFTWDQVRQSWARSFAHDNEGDEVRLGTLEEDVDLRSFVPLQQVSKGTSWPINPGAFSVLFIPGGDPGLSLETGTDFAKSLPFPIMDNSDIGRRFELILGKHLEGWGRGVYRGVCKRDGANCAEIQIEAHLTAEGADDPEFGTKFGAKGELSIEGQLFWELDRHRAHSAELRCDVASHVYLESRISDSKNLIGTWTLRQECDLIGSTTLDVHCEER